MCVCLCRLIGGKVDPAAVAFYGKIEDKEKVLVGLTLFFDMPLPELARQNTAGIDVVSSASKKASAEGFSNGIREWIAQSRRLSD